MGTCLCCLRSDDLIDDHRHCFRYCGLFPSCCGMYAALFPTSEDEVVRALPSAQSSGLLDEATLESSAAVSHTYDRRYVQPMAGVSRAGKTMGMQSEQQNGGRRVCVIQHAKGVDWDEDKMSAGDFNSQQPIKNGKVDCLVSSLEEEDICPTCLEGYDLDNPKIITKCGHHFHLVCILEWMERSSHCPVCYQEMVFYENP